MEASAETRILELDPGHGAMDGQLGLRLEVDGERIVTAEAEVGYAHRGFEKRCEGLGWHQVLPLVERFQPQSGILAATAYCLGVEKIMGLDPPLRSSWHRVLGCELARVADHFSRVAQLARVLGAGGPAAWALEAREITWDCLEALTGAARQPHYIRIGGVERPMPDDFGHMTRRRIDALMLLWADVDTVLTGNRGFVDRLQGTGVLSATECLRLGATGPMRRSAGVADDLRRSEPYLVYDELAFDVPVGSAGDNYDRYLVCLEEIRQSLAMVRQCIARIEALRSGPVRSHDPWLDRRQGSRGTMPLKLKLELAGIYADGPVVPVGEAWTAVESADGEFAFYLVSDGGASPSRVHCRAASFFHAQALSGILARGSLSEVAATLALVHIGAMECDR